MSLVDEHADDRNPIREPRPEAASDTDEITPAAWVARPDVPKRQPPTRHELLDMIDRGDKRLSYRELVDALEDGRLTEEEAEHFAPGWAETSRQLRDTLENNSAVLQAQLKDSVLSGPLQEQIQAAQKSFTGFAEPIRQAAEQFNNFERVVGPMRDAIAAATEAAFAQQRFQEIASRPSVMPAIRPHGQVLAELNAEQTAELKRVAELVEAGNEANVATADMTAKALNVQERLLEEYAGLRGELQDERQKRERSDRAIRWLTAVLVVLGVVTVVLGALTVVEAWPGLIGQVTRFLSR